MYLASCAEVAAYNCGSSSSGGSCEPGGFGNWTAGCNGVNWTGPDATIDATCPNPGPPPFPCDDSNMGAGALYECNSCEWTYLDPP